LTVLGKTVSPVLLVLLPPLLVNPIVARPAAVWVGIIKVRLVAPNEEEEVAKPLTVTFAPAKLVPVAVMEAPGSALVGEKLVIVGAVAGAAVTVKLVPLMAVPTGVLMAMVPLAAPDGTIKVRLVELTSVNVAGVLAASSTAVAPVKLRPVTVTVVPGTPLVGLKLVIPGGPGVTAGSSFLQLASHRVPTTALAPE
jgi:hypothetical protein